MRPGDTVRHREPVCRAYARGVSAHYPLVLASLLQDDHPGQVSTPVVRAPSPAVVANLVASHFTLKEGFRLFEHEEPTPYLQSQIDKLEACANDEVRSHKLVGQPS